MVIIEVLGIVTGLRATVTGIVARTVILVEIAEGFGKVLDTYSL
jgi:hypothetical protein